jgi:hypothetical protein
MANSGWNMYVFRDGRRILPGQRLVWQLEAALRALSRENCPAQDHILDALIAAGELECALADAGCSPTEAGAGGEAAAAWLTDALAELLLYSAAGKEVQDSKGILVTPRELLARLDSICPPAQLQVSVHEGFAYYALHPLKIVDLLDTLTVPPTAAVLGIRSIGVTLSAVLTAALKRRGSEASRITVRPAGHPYERRLTLSDEQKSWIRSRGRQARFLVIDEGPGLSGSSFLAVAEALTEAGIQAENILLIGSRQPDPAQLRAPNAEQRWNRFRFTCLASAPYVPEGAAIAIGGGQWRNELLAPDEPRPAAWAQLEMAKFLSVDRELFYKFEGFGHFGGEIGQRARVLAESGLGPDYLGSKAGFGMYGISAGRRLRPAELPIRELLKHLAEYCAFRLRHFPADDSQPSALDEMASWNWSLEFGPTADDRALEVEHRVFCDARMMPHKWLVSPDGRLLKLDGVAHGDDHFFPGPCDIAWDLASTIVEWNLPGPEQEYLLEQYGRASGDDARRRLPGYLKAYVAFRFGWCKMAALASAGTADEPLLWRDFQRYRGYAGGLGRISAALAAPANATAAFAGDPDGEEPTAVRNVA